MRDRLYTVKLTKEQWLRVAEAVNAISGVAHNVGAEMQSQLLDDIYEAIDSQLEETA